MAQVSGQMPPPPGDTLYTRHRAQVAVNTRVKVSFYQKEEQKHAWKQRSKSNDFKGQSVPQRSIRRPRRNLLTAGSWDKPQKGARQGRLCKEQLFQQQLTGKLSQHVPGLGKPPEVRGQLAFYGCITQVG